MKESVGALIVAKDTGRVFLMLRSEDSSDPLTWAVVAGAIDEGETPVMALMREIEEETQIDPRIITYKFIDFEKHDDYNFHYFEGYVYSEFTPTLDHENLDWGWFDIDDLPQPLFPNLENKIKNSKLDLL